MQKNFHEVLLEILTLISYPNDKEKFVKEFEELNHMETVANLLEKLPQELQEKVQKNKVTQEEIRQHIPDEDYLAELTNVSGKALIKYVEVIMPQLSVEQREKVQQVLLQ
jgi:hypothetical protein